MCGRWEVSDAQWELIEPILRPKRRADGRGRPWQDTRRVLNGILWVLGTGAQWRELPQKYPRTRPAIAASSSGCETANWKNSARAGRGVTSSRQAQAGGGFHRRLLHVQKRWPCRRAHQARQGDENHRPRR
jgi:transposase